MTVVQKPGNHCHNQVIRQRLPVLEQVKIACHLIASVPFVVLTKDRQPESKCDRISSCMPARACPRNLTKGDRRCRKDNKTEEKTCIKLGPGRLGALKETHQLTPPPVSLLYAEAFLGGGGLTL
jgi:hypothetical protein